MGPSKNVRMFPKKYPTKFPNRNVDKFLDKSAVRSPAKAVKMFPSKNVAKCPVKSANKCPDKSAEKSPGKNAKMCQGKNASKFPKKNVNLSIFAKFVSSLHILEDKQQQQKSLNPFNQSFPVAAPIHIHYQCFSDLAQDFGLHISGTKAVLFFHAVLIIVHSI